MKESLYLLIITLATFSLFVVTQAEAQESLLHIAGVVTDSTSGERLPAASIRLVDKNIGTVSNQYGYFSIDVSKGQVTRFEISYVGYHTRQFSFAVLKDTLITVSLPPITTMLNEVSIEA